MMLCGRRRHHIHADLRRIIQPDFVLDDLRLQSSLAKLLSYVFGSLLVFWRSGQMRRRRERPQMLLRQLGIGNRQKLLLRLLLAAEIAIAKDS